MAGGKCPAVVTVIALLISLQNGAADDEPFGFTCPVGSQVILGQHLVSTAMQNCTFSRTDGANGQGYQANYTELLDVDSVEYALNTTGRYSYTCGNHSGNISVVLSQYHIALCQGCERHVHTIVNGTAVAWTVANEPCGMVTITSEKGVVNVSDASYTFDSNGDFLLQCSKIPATRAAIRVVSSCSSSSSSSNSNSNSSQAQSTASYLPLLYAHAAAMILTFGVLLPVGAFMAHNRKHLVHKLMQPATTVLGLAGLALVVAYVQMTSRAHFRQTVHAVVGVVVLRLDVGHSPAARARAMEAMASGGLAIWPAPKVAAITVGVLYGAWLLAIAAIYVLVVVGGVCKERSEHSFKTNGTDMEAIAPAPSRPRTNSILKPLSKGVISEAKMVQLRKKSIDYLEAVHQCNKLNKELGLTTPHPVAMDADQSTLTAETDLSRTEEEPKRENSNGSLTPPPQHTLPPSHIQQQPFLSPEPQTPPPTQEDKSLNMIISTSDEEGEGLSEKEEVPDLELDRFNRTSSPRPVKKAHSFNVPPRHLDLDLESHGDSLRVTRHSVKPKTPPKPPMDELSVEIPTGKPGNLNARRRRPALVPPIITTTPAEESDCVFTKQVSLDSDVGRDLSPCPSTSSLQNESSKPRKKKVSVAPLEAIPIPPTPVALRPPSMSRSASFAQTNVFSDNALRSVMQMSHDAIVCANAAGDIVFWSAGAVKMFGYTPGEAIGSSLEVHGLSKNGHEFPVEVNVTSFVIDGELFYTGVISELVPKNAQGRSRGTSVSTMGSENHECTMKQKALAVGAQMKMAHKLKSAEHITHKELENILATSLAASKIEVQLLCLIQPRQLEEMITGIMKAGDPGNTGVVTFMNLLPLLYQHRLYISESGLIVRYGKTKSNRGGTTRHQRTLSQVKNFFHLNASFLLWFGVYLAANAALVMGGMLSNGRSGWERWAYGTGPVLSMSCVLVLLPTMSSLIQAMSSAQWMAKLLPLHRSVHFHLAMAVGVAFWSAVHVTLHLCSFALDTHNTTTGAGGKEEESRSDYFMSSLVTHLCPAVTGLMILVALGLMCVSALPVIRKRMRFIAFYMIHWMTTILVYVLILIHGDWYWNPSFWKWLLPLVFAMGFELVHRHWITPKYTVAVKTAGPYDDISRVTVIETEKPKQFDFIPGQFVMLNFQKIDYFGWHRCYISSGPKEPKLTIYVPKEGNVWFTEMFLTMKAHPFNRVISQSNSTSEEKKASPPTECLSEQLTLQFSGPYGPGSNSVFDYKISALVCAGDGPHASKSLLSKLLQYRKHNSCLCGCHPILTKLYFVWVIPSGNDFEWFTDYLSDLCLDEHLQRYLDIRVFLTNIDSPPDELASALLQLGLKTAGESCIGRRPSQPQLNNLYSMTSYGIPDFDGLLEYIYTQHSNLWSEGSDQMEIGVFTLGDIHKTMLDDLNKACRTATRPGQVLFKQSRIAS
eukprot:Em0019g755a